MAKNNFKIVKDERQVVEKSTESTLVPLVVDSANTISNTKNSLLTADKSKVVDKVSQAVNVTTKQIETARTMAELQAEKVTSKNSSSASGSKNNNETKVNSKNEEIKEIQKQNNVIVDGGTLPQNNNKVVVKQSVFEKFLIWFFGE